MRDITKILVPVDFSACCWTALMNANWLGDTVDGQLHVLHVIRYPNNVFLNVIDQREGGLQRTVHDVMRTEAASELDSFLSAALGDGAAFVQRLLAWGDPAERIVERAKRGHYGLIVMGTHGRTELTPAFLGSVAERVISMAPCPVSTVSPTQHQPVDRDSSSRGPVPRQRYAT